MWPQYPFDAPKGLTIMIDIRSMPKVELHLHLDGTLTPATVLTLAERHHAADLLPGTSEDTIRKWFVFRDFPHFVEVKRVLKRLLRTADDFALVVYEAGRTLSAQHVRYAEITLTPYSLIDTLDYGLTIEMLLDGLEQGRQQARRAFGIELRWVFDIPRNRAFADYRTGGSYVPGAAERTLEYALLGKPQGVIGLGLGGNEVNAPPEPFAPVFAEAKRQGLRSLPHAGESEGPASIWGAVNALQADRIGHGVRAAQDKELLALLAERQIPLEVNVTSNVCLRFFERTEDHPLRALDDAGLLLTVNTDDPEMVGTSLTREYQQLVDVFGYGAADVIRFARNGFLACFAEPDLKNRLLAAFDEWAATAANKDAS
ncbi:MAG: adenosine deaminase [Anaerolineae bacterium]|nr:adenosine deaminase [Anaerolineae bacterium]